MFTIVLLVVLAFALCVANMGPTASYFSDIETVEGRFTTSGWCEPIKICFLCPCWGISGACKWAVFIYGQGFRGEAAVQLIKGDKNINAEKSWVICDSVIFAVFDLRDAKKGWYDLRVELDNGCEGVLNRGFHVMKWWYGCIPNSSRGYPGGEENVTLEKELDEKEPEKMLITLRGELPKLISSTFLVSPGCLIKGRVVEKGRRSLRLEFNLHDTPEAHYDLVVVTFTGWKLLFERAITPEDRYRQINITSIQPSSAYLGQKIELSVNGEGMPSDIDLTLKKDGLELHPIWIDWISPTQLACTFDLSIASPGVYSFIVHGPYGITTTLADCFTVYGEEHLEGTPPEEGPTQEIPQDEIPIEQEPPEVHEPIDFRILPSSGSSGEIVDVVVEGGVFYTGMQARLRNENGEAMAFICACVSRSRLECRFNLYNLPVGIYRLEIIDSDGRDICMAGEFEVI
jgi:hypothetical protein